MHDLGPAASSPFAPLVARFGDRLALRRDADGAAWSLDGRSATVAPRADGSLEATFVDRDVPDAGGAMRVAAVYRPATGAYRSTAAGCARMVDDMVAFFSGVREPRFAFARLDDVGRL